MAFYFHVLTTMHGQNHIKFVVYHVKGTFRIPLRTLKTTENKTLLKDITMLTRWNY